MPRGESILKFYVYVRKNLHFIYGSDRSRNLRLQRLKKKERRTMDIRCNCCNYVFFKNYISVLIFFRQDRIIIECSNNTAMLRTCLFNNVYLYSRLVKPILIRTCATYYNGFRQFSRFECRRCTRNYYRYIG